MICDKRDVYYTYEYKWGWVYKDIILMLNYKGLVLASCPHIYLKIKGQKQVGWE